MRAPIVLAIDPTPTGFAYALLRAPNRIVDWGVTNIRTNKIARSLKIFEKLIVMYEPTIIVIDKPSYKDDELSCGKKLEYAFAKRSAIAKIPFKRINRKDIYDQFQEFDAHCKEEIVDKVAEWFPEISYLRPKRREFWQTEKPTINIFDAAAAALTYYAQYEEATCDSQ